MHAFPQVSLWKQSSADFISLAGVSGDAASSSLYYERHSGPQLVFLPLVLLGPRGQHTSCLRLPEMICLGLPIHTLYPEYSDSVLQADFTQGEVRFWCSLNHSQIHPQCERSHHRYLGLDEWWQHIDTTGAVSGLCHTMLWPWCSCFPAGMGWHTSLFAGAPRNQTRICCTRAVTPLVVGKYRWQRCMFQHLQGMLRRFARAPQSRMEPAAYTQNLSRGTKLPCPTPRWALCCWSSAASGSCQSDTSHAGWLSVLIHSSCSSANKPV